MKNKTWLSFFAFLVLLYLIKLFIAKDISPIIKTDYKYSFNNFIIYTYLFSLIGYLFKIVFLTGLFKTSFFLFDIKKGYSVLNIVIFGEMFKLLLEKGSLIFSFFFIKKMTLEQFLTFQSNFSFVKILGIDDIQDFKYILNAINVIDLIYVIFLVFLFSEKYQATLLKSIKVMALPYLLLLFTVGIIKTFLSF
jgi:hypothetical protein